MSLFKARRDRLGEERVSCVVPKSARVERGPVVVLDYATRRPVVLGQMAHGEPAGLWFYWVRGLSAGDRLGEANLTRVVLRDGENSKRIVYSRD